MIEISYASAPWIGKPVLNEPYLLRQRDAASCQLPLGWRSVTGTKLVAHVLQLIAGVRGALNGLLAELLDDYIRTHVVEPSNTEQAHSYWK
jgi:hypothetical protein